MVLDRAAIMTFSKAGQDIAKQMQAYSNQAKNQLAAEQQDNDGRNLQQQVAILARRCCGPSLSACSAPCSAGRCAGSACHFDHSSTATGCP